MSHDLKNKILGCLMGSAVGDALGTTQEFVPMHCAMENPIKDLVGQGKFKLEAGMWTDDTSMMLCLCESLLELKGSFDGRDQQARYYEWYSNGHLSSNGVCFDIGKTTRLNLLDNRKENREFSDKISDAASGNGGLMRLAPVPLYYMSGDVMRAIELSGQSSMTTHPSEISRDCCRYYAALIIGAVLGESREMLLSSTELYVPPGLDKDYWTVNPLRSEVLDIVANCSYQKSNPPDICNSAYVVKTMEAALWAFYHSDSFEDGALKIVNLGDDADTAGCIYGMLAGAFYGNDAIPEAWRQKIVFKDLIFVYSEEIVQVYNSNKNNNAQRTEKSPQYEEAQELLHFLESQYQPLRRRIDPCPTMFRAMSEFDKSVEHFYAAMEEKVNSLHNLSSEVKLGLPNDFRQRIEVQDRPVVANRTSIPTGRANLLGALKARNQ